MFPRYRRRRHCAIFEALTAIETCRGGLDLSSTQETDMNTHLKRKIAFALSMGIVTTGLISFTLPRSIWVFPRDLC